MVIAATAVLKIRSQDKDTLIYRYSKENITIILSIKIQMVFICSLI